MQSAKLIWEKALTLLKDEMTEVSFNSWIHPIEPLTVEDGRLILLSQNKLAQTTLSNMYAASVASAVNRANDTALSVSFIDGDEKERYLSPVKEEHDKDFILNPRYTFDTFVIGGSNAFAHAAAKAVADNPASAYNPLFIYGGVGLGKTHLMHAIGNQIKSANKRAKVIYVTSETFTNEVIEAIREDKRGQLRNKYRGADVLMVDDIQFIAGMVSTQEEFFNTFNALQQARKQIVISSDKPPMEITTLEERLRSRFEGGLITDIQPPDKETRIAILRKKAAAEHTEINEEVLSFIAENVISNIRQLEGSLTRVIAYSRLTRQPIDIALADTALKDIIPGYGANRKITMDLIQEAVADYFSLDVSALSSKRRTAAITYPRHIAMYLCKELTERTLDEIGANFGGKDHSTVINACRNIERKIIEDPQTKTIVEDITKRLRK